MRCSYESNLKVYNWLMGSRDPISVLLLEFRIPFMAISIVLGFIYHETILESHYKTHAIGAFSLLDTVWYWFLLGLPVSMLISIPFLLPFSHGSASNTKSLRRSMVVTDNEVEKLPPINWKGSLLKIASYLFKFSHPNLLPVSILMIAILFMI